MNEAVRSVAGGLRYPSSQTLRDEKNTENSQEISKACEPEIGQIKNRGKGLRLKWERVNSVTHKLAIIGRASNTPASHGQWPGFRTSYAAAWLMNVNWWSATDKNWVGRCRDDRGDWFFGPTTFEQARRETKDWVLGKSVAGGFTDNSIRDLHESALLAK